MNEFPESHTTAISLPNIFQELPSHEQNKRVDCGPVRLYSTGIFKVYQESRQESLRKKPPGSFE